LTDTTIAIVKAPKVKNDRTRIMRRACAEISLSSARSNVSHSSATYVTFTSTNTPACKATGTPANPLRAIQAVENGTSETENRCAKFLQISLGVGASAYWST